MSAASFSLHLCRTTSPAPAALLWRRTHSRTQINLSSVSMAGEAGAAGWLLLIAAALVLVAGAASSEAHTTDATALLAFRNTLRAAGGEPPAQLRSWRAPGPCTGGAVKSAWQGVRCHVPTGRVQLLQLEGLGLQGVAPDLALLSPLQGLRALSLSSNNLTGAFPDVAALPALSFLFLSQNGLAGEIPDGAFAPLKELQKLDISGNGFSGPIPSSITTSSKLLSVNISYNNFSGPIPEGLWKFGASSFQGNNGLYGPPLNVSCPQTPSPSPVPGPSANYPGKNGL